jgi:hypothetical protein
LQYLNMTHLSPFMSSQSTRQHPSYLPNKHLKSQTVDSCSVFSAVRLYRSILHNILELESHLIINKKFGRKGFRNVHTLLQIRLSFFQVYVTSNFRRQTNAWRFISLLM